VTLHLLSPGRQPRSRITRTSLAFWQAVTWAGYGSWNLRGPLSGASMARGLHFTPAAHGLSPAPVQTAPARARAQRANHSPSGLRRSRRAAAQGTEQIAAFEKNKDFSCNLSSCPSLFDIVKSVWQRFMAMTNTHPKRRASASCTSRTLEGRLAMLGFASREWPNPNYSPAKASPPPIRSGLSSAPRTSAKPRRIGKTAGKTARAGIPLASFFSPRIAGG